MIDILTSFRFIFALMIFLHHFPVTTDPATVVFKAGGTLGVSFFFILSGFVLSFGYYDKLISKKVFPKAFITKRILKLIPIHYLCLFIWLFTVKFNFSLELIPNLFMLQSWIPIKSVYFSGNAVSWCLSNQVFFYLMFPILAKVLIQTNKRNLAITLLITLIAYFFLLLFIPEKYTHAILYINPLCRLIDFSLGILVYRLYSYLKKNTTFVDRNYAYFYYGAILLVIFAVFLYQFIPVRYSYSILYWIPISFFILVLSLSEKVVSNFSKKILLNKVMLELGRCSFCFYMIHTLSIKLFFFFFKHFGLVISWQCKLAVILPITILVSYLCNKFFEIPVSKKLISLTNI